MLMRHGERQHCTTPPVLYSVLSMSSPCPPIVSCCLQLVLQSCLVVFSMSSACPRHVLTLSSACPHLVLTVSSPCPHLVLQSCRVVFSMSSPCPHRVLTMSSPCPPIVSCCLQHVLTLSSPCPHHVLTLSSNRLCSVVTRDPLLSIYIPYTYRMSFFLQYAACVWGLFTSYDLFFPLIPRSDSGSHTSRPFIDGSTHDCYRWFYWSRYLS